MKPPAELPRHLPVEPPRARQVPVEHALHGAQWSDEYPGYWRVPRQTIATTSPAAALNASVLVKGTDNEQLLIDFNVEADGHDYDGPGDVEYSPDHAFLAWSVDTVGAERYVVHIRELNTGKDQDIIHDVESITWGSDRYLFYTRVNLEHRPNQVFRHELGTDAASDVLVYEEHDSRFFCSVWTSLSGRYASLAEYALEQAFALKIMGLLPPDTAVEKNND